MRTDTIPEPAFTILEILYIITQSCMYVYRFIHAHMLSYNPGTGLSDLGVRNCAPQLDHRGSVLLLIDDKNVEAEEICATAAGMVCFHVYFHMHII